MIILRDYLEKEEENEGWGFKRERGGDMVAGKRGRGR